MYEEIIKGQADNSLTINYNKWIFDCICPYIGNRVMDVGAGSGNFLPYLLNRELIVAIDVLDIFIDNLRRSCGSQSNVYIFKCDIQDDNIMQVSSRYNIDTVICNNVLEHVRDDLNALKNIHKILNNRGNLILVLPAFRFLYSKWDKSVGHFRRYDFKDIKEKLTISSFSIQKNFYMNVVGLFGWFLNGKILRNTPTKSCLVRRQAVFFDRYIVRPLRKLETICRPPFGQSLIIIAKPN